MSLEPLDQETRASRKKDKLSELRDRDTAALRAVMATREGRRTMWRIFEATGFHSISFTGNSETYFREGKRSVGLSLHTEMMDLCPEAYWLMVNENRKSKEA